MDLLLFIVAIYYTLRGNWNIPIIILLTISTAYWEIFPAQSEFIFSHNVSDMGIVLLYTMILMVYNRRRYIIPSQTGALKNILTILYLFIIASIAGDVLLRGTSLIDVVKTTRQLLFIPGGFILFRYIPPSCYKQIFKNIIAVNAIVCVLSLLQYLHIVSFLKFTPDEFSWIQLYIPAGLFVSTILIVSDFGKQYRPVLRYMMFALCLVVSVISTIRSFNFAILFCAMFIYLFSSGRFCLKRAFAGLALCAVVVSAILANDRFESKINKTNHDIEEGSFATRIGVYNTAVDIATSSPGNIIFGSGWHHVAGIEDGEHILLNETEAAYLTPDISWSPLLLRFGIFGTAIYTLIWLFFILYGWKYREVSQYALVLCILSIGYLIISVAGTQIYVMRNILIPILLFYITVAQANGSTNKV